MRRLAFLSLTLLSAAVPAAGTTRLPLSLDYVGRYLSQPGEPDHLLEAVPVAGGRTVIVGNRGLALVDVDRLPVSGTTAFIHRLTGLNGRSAVLLDDTHLVVELAPEEGADSAGFAVVEVEGDTLRYLVTVDEDGVLYGRAAVSGSLLYVAAHRAGLRIFDLSHPGTPVLVGRLDQGLDDAWAVAVEGGVAWVADGGGGLKALDVSDPEHPVLLGGENPELAVGTAEDVILRGDTVYTAAGGAGVCAYPGGDPAARRCLSLDGYAKDLEWLGDLLAVATGTGIWILEPHAGGTLSVAGHEIAARRGSGTLRICYGLCALNETHLIACDWSAADLFLLTPSESSTTPDINCSRQRIRFPPEGGTVEARLWNWGGVPLHVTGVQFGGSPAFSTDLKPATLEPGEELDFTITAGPASPDDEGVLSILSDDPDENPLPIQLFAATPYLDPGEAVPDFTLPAWTPDPETGELTQSSFTLSEHRGRVVWLQVFGFW